MTIIDVSDNERGLRLFGPPSMDLSHWLKAPCWSLEEAVAISLGYEPDRLCLGLILLKCPEELRNRPLRGSPQVFFRLSPLVQMYVGRLSLLERAVEMDELPAKLVNGKCKLKPFDFLRWFDAQTTEDWSRIPFAVYPLLEAMEAADASPPAGRNKGREAALNYLMRLMRKFPNCPPHEKRTDLRQKLMDQFDIGKHISDDVIGEAKKSTKVDWFKPGRPSKGK